jgi:hypothetical protein
MRQLLIRRSLVRVQAGALRKADRNLNAGRLPGLTGADRALAGKRVLPGLWMQ